MFDVLYALLVFTGYAVGFWLIALVAGPIAELACNVTHHVVGTTRTRVRRARLFCNECLAYLRSLPLTKGRRVTKVATPKQWRITIQRLIISGYPHHVAVAKVHMDNTHCLCLRCYKPIGFVTGTYERPMSIYEREARAEHEVNPETKCSDCGTSFTEVIASDKVPDLCLSCYYFDMGVAEHPCPMCINTVEEMGTMCDECMDHYGVNDDLDREDREDEERLQSQEREFEGCSDTCSYGHSSDRDCKYYDIFEDDIRHYDGYEESCLECLSTRRWIAEYGHDYDCKANVSCETCDKKHEGECSDWHCVFCKKDHSGLFSYCPLGQTEYWHFTGTVWDDVPDFEEPPIRTKRQVQVREALAKTDRAYANPVYEVDGFPYIPPAHLTAEQAEKVLVQHNRDRVTWKIMTPARAQQEVDSAYRWFSQALAVHRALPGNSVSLGHLQSAQLQLTEAKEQRDRVAGRKEKR